LSAIARNMATSLRHRGPEDEGVWADAASGVAFGHRRLSIIDLSAAGHQPMHSTCGRYVITYNGEIYNFKALRAELEQLGQTFRGHSDTEVMLGAITRWGVAQSLEKFNGMFAFALWDLQDKVLYLSRDRAGEKPLYYGWIGQTSSRMGSTTRHADSTSSWRANSAAGCFPIAALRSTSLHRPMRAPSINRYRSWLHEPCAGSLHRSCSSSR